MTYYAHIMDGVINGCGQCRVLSENALNVVISEEVYNNIDMYIYSEGEVILNPNYEAEQAQKEHERIQGLSMTRSDFFDGTIKAFGADADDLLLVLEPIIANSPLREVEKKVAINNYKNALNFYRKHPLFTLLSEIPLSIYGKQVIITADKWDKFFDETDKGNKLAYEYLCKEETE